MATHNQQRKNLIKLANFLEEHHLKLQFDMLWYADGGDSISLVKPSYECGTVACAAGFGPMAGIKPKHSECWEDYISRVFYNKNSHENLEYYFLFSSNWRRYDNTAMGAAARIRYFLDHKDTLIQYYKDYNPLLYKDYLLENRKISQ